jgi:hypothetical protein
MSDAAYGAVGKFLAFEAFGVRMWLGTNRPEARERLPAIVPPGSRPTPVAEAEHRLAIIGDEGGTYGVDVGGAWAIERAPLELALEILDSTVRARVAVNAAETVFVHAGVAAVDDRAIVIPGGSFTGKTTLVASLVRAGAVYYSDEFAALDSAGRVHPYAKPLSIRDADRLQKDHKVESLGGKAGETALPVGAIVVTTYRAGTQWRPRRLSSGEGALALLANTVPARERPEEAMRAVTRAVENAIVLEGDRGEASEVAPLLLDEFRSRSE